MAFNVRFYTMGKEVNSTAIPTGDGTLIPCVANGRLDMLTPSIKLQRGLGGGTDSPRSWNYCYIHPFNRFYFIQNWSYEGGLWYADCQVDVLGTYRSEIGSLTAYILRSAHTSDGTITDSMYPAKNSFSFQTATAASPWITDIFFGTIVVGIAGTGSTYYYKMTYVNFTNFIKDLMSDTYASTVISSLGLQVNSEAKAIIDPLQYITSVIYIPVQDWAGMSDRSIQVGFGTITVNCSLVASAGVVTTPTVTISNIPKHPQALTRGEFLNHSPFSKYTLDVPPFGAIELDPDKFSGGINISFTVDWCTGNAVMRIFGVDTGSEIALVKGMVGVQVQVGQVLKTGFGLLSMIQGAAGVAAAFASNPVAGISGAAGLAKDAIESQIPSLNTVGSTGSYADIMGSFTLYCKFTRIVDESNATRGRPLYQARQIDTLPGYLVVADPDITGMTATGREKEIIEQFLTGGFYYA